MKDQVIVYANNVEYRPDNDYGIELTFTKVGGWQLWDTWGKNFREYKLIGGQWHGEPFCLIINDEVICGSMPNEMKKRKVIGWDGWLRVTP